VAETGPALGRNEIEFWNGAGGERWARRQSSWEKTLAPLTPPLLAAAQLVPGLQVVDVGCGCSAATLEIARRVGPSGHVLGVDVSTPILDRARRQLPAGLPVQYIQADATTYHFAAASFDRLISRLGIMFFTDPMRAFANLRTALKSGGRLAFVCFRSPRDNPWMRVPLEAAYAYVPPLPKPGPEDPGAFSFAAEERVQRILAGAGFGEIALARLDVAFDVGAGGGIDEAIANALEVGPTSRTIEGQPPQVIAKVAATLRDVFAPYLKGNRVELGAALWLVTARNP
jgi:SAM-dependent methyltransferase